MRLGARLVLVTVLLAACDSGGGTGEVDDDSGIGPTGDTGTPVGEGGSGDASMRDADAARPPREASVPAPDCGDNVKADSEECDDGNVDDGDGCSSQCTKEGGFNCPAMVGKCAAICGDGLLVAGEACDDLNVDADDGCSGSCQVEQGWSCLGSGAGTCTAASCGDGVIAGAENCDDGNAIPGDGCSTSCAMEQGYLCPVPGMACIAERCGDGIRAGSEACDDGETNSMTKGGDGCTAACDAVEPNYSCPFTGGPCTRTSVCGNGLLTSDEMCDDRNTNSGDGCSATCTFEPGWQCATVGRACTAARCGDMIVAGSEQCEDGNAATGDGCAACKIESGYACAFMGGKSVCHATVCGDGTVEGDEACDDGNNIAGDGCSPNSGNPAVSCKYEPTCEAGKACVSVCGDGIRLPTDTKEECDDGNRRDGDGCSKTCKQENGYVCRNVVSTLPANFPLTVTFRDFISFAQNGGTKHRDFETFSGDDASLGMVEDTLVNGKPVYTGKCTPNTPPTGCGGPGKTQRQTNSKAEFDEWYSNGTPASMKKLVTTMSMTRVVTPTVTDNYTNPTFGQQLFPLDNAGWMLADTNAALTPVTAIREAKNSSHDFGFTTEIHHWFQFKGGEVLTFSGDDDVWVFIGGKLALDLGGLHPKQTRTITLNTNGTIGCTTSGAACGGVANLGLVVGNVYEMALFHAERHTGFSNFDLTLRGFTAPLSVCSPVCGDGVITSGEVCDEGSLCAGGDKAGMTCYNPAPQAGDTLVCTGTGGTCTSNNNGSYGHCKADCSDLGPHCGDAIKQTGETCDLGAMNTGGYKGCTADCKAGPQCGDGKVDSFYGEQCDLPEGNMGGYGGCAVDCKFSDRCGDGQVQPDHEVCDDGQNRSAYGGCGPGCVLAPRCGDGVVQSARGEQCDDGAGNDGHYGGCKVDCRKASRCGDRVIDRDAGETCDDGNLNNFDGCSSICQSDVVI